MLRIRIHSEKETGSVSSDRYLILRESEFCGILQCISCQICLQKPVLPVKKSISGPLRNLPRGYGRMPVQRGHPIRDGVFHGVSWKDKVQSCGGTQQTYPKSCDKEKGEERMSQKYDKKAIQTVFVLFCFPFFYILFHRYPIPHIVSIGDRPAAASFFRMFFMCSVIAEISLSLS